MLSQRLRELAADGIVTRRRLPPPAASRVYELTERGRELEPVILALGRWGTSVPFPPDGHELGPDSLILALKTVFDARAAGGTSVSVELRIDEQPFSVHVGGGGLAVTRGAATRPDAVLAASPETLAALLWRGLPLAEAEQSGSAHVEGDRRKLRRFLTVFAVVE